MTTTSGQEAGELPLVVQRGVADRGARAHSALSSTGS
jgi:hypothetical protein